MPAFAAAFALLLGQAAAVAAPGEEAAATSDVLEGKADSEDRLTVPVRIESQGPFQFLIDTGSQRTVISTALASQLNLESGPVIRIISVGGTDMVSTAYVEQIELGSRTISRILVPLLLKHNMGSDGIIGTDSLQDQRVLLDFTSNQIEIGDARTLGGSNGYEIVVRARRRSGQLVMTDARIDGIRTAVVVDTGAGTSIGNRALQRALQKRRGAGAIITLQSVTGHDIQAEIGFARKLEIRDIAVTNLLIAFTDTPAFRELGLDAKPALFLGMRELRLFKRVAIDFSKRRIMFDLPPLE